MHRLLLVVLLVAAGTAPAATAGQPRNGTPTAERGPTVHAVYPNPVAPEDRGEFVVLALPNGTALGGLSISDGGDPVPLPNGTAGGRVAVTTAPERVRTLTEHRVVGVEGHLAFANGGGRVALHRNGTVLDTARYQSADEGAVGVAAGTGVRWRPLGATDRPVVTSRGGRVRAFTPPDAPAVPLDPIRAADQRVLLAGYTLSSGRVADALIAASRRGATVRVLLEGEPIGGRTRRAARTLDRLAAAGVEIHLLTGPHARYRYHHAKYAVADDRAVVLTENWKPAGTGGNSSRGWGVVTVQPRIVRGLAETFRADSGWRDTVAWDRYRQGREFERGGTATGEYPSRFAPERVPVNRTELLVTPDNAQRSLIDDLVAAEDSVAVIQPTVGEWESPLLVALRAAARRGVEVRLLLSSAWYVREDNRRTVERFQQWADRNDAPLSAKLADPAGRYQKIHAKGAVIDDRVAVGSLNWNEQAATRNREVVLVLHGSAVADYYRRAFDADWRGGRPTVPVGPLAALAGAAAIAVLAARRVRFAD